MKLQHAQRYINDPSGPLSIIMTDDTIETDNETRRFIADALGARKPNVPLSVNPAFESLATTLIDGKAGSVRLSFAATPAMCQGNGVIGGGYLAAMLDTALAVAVLSSLAPGQTCATISLSVNMIAAAKVGSLNAAASVEAMKRRTAFATATLRDDGGKLIASATSALAVLTVK